MIVSAQLDFQALCPPRAALLARALKLARERQAAEDLVQDAMLQALETWPRFKVPDGADPADCVSAWLYRIMRNAFIDGCRERARRSITLEERADDVVDETMSRAPGRPDEMLARAEGPGDDTTRQAIAALPPIWREVLERKAWGYTDAQIHAELKIQMWRCEEETCEKNPPVHAEEAPICTCGQFMTEDLRNIRKRMHRGRKRLFENMALPPPGYESRESSLPSQDRDRRAEPRETPAADNAARYASGSPTIRQPNQPRRCA
jgi:RNA polymerase sigma factor (sigma-70 family)